MIALHAPDKPGILAHKASQFGNILQFNLLAASSPTLELEKRLEALERIFTIWPSLCRSMNELEQAAPRCAQAGQDNAGILADIRDRTAQKTAPRSAETGATSCPGMDHQS